MESDNEANSTCSICSSSIVKYCEALSDGPPNSSESDGDGDQIASDFFDDFDDNDFVDNMVSCLDTDKFNFDEISSTVELEDTPRSTKGYRVIYGKSLFDCLSNAEEEAQQSWHMKCNPQQSNEVLARSQRLIEKLRNPNKNLYQSPLKESPEVRFQFTSRNLPQGRCPFYQLPIDLAKDEEKKSFRDQGTQCDIKETASTGLHVMNENDILVDVTRNRQLCHEGIQGSIITENVKRNLIRLSNTDITNTVCTNSEDIEMMQKLEALVRTSGGEMDEIIGSGEFKEMFERSSALIENITQIAEETRTIAAWLQSIDKFEADNACDEERQEEMSVSELETNCTREIPNHLKKFKEKLVETTSLQQSEERESMVTDISMAVTEEIGETRERNCDLQKSRMKLLKQIEVMERVDKEETPTTAQEKERLSNDCEYSCKALSVREKYDAFFKNLVLLSEVSKKKPLSLKRQDLISNAEPPERHFSSLCNNGTSEEEKYEEQSVKAVQYDTDVSAASLDGISEEEMANETNDENLEKDHGLSAIPETRISLVPYDDSSEEDEPRRKRKCKALDVDKYGSSFCLRCSPPFNYHSEITEEEEEEEEEKEEETCRPSVRSGPRRRLPLN